MPFARRFGSSAILFSAALALCAPLQAAQASDEQCERGDATVLPLIPVGARQFPGVPVTLNGQQLTMLVDIANPHTTLYRKAVEQAGLQVQSSPTTYATVNVLTTMVPSFTLGPISSKGWFVVDESDVDAAGRIGANFLSKYDYELWWANKQITLSAPKGCRKTFLAAWDPQAHVVPFRVELTRKDMRAWFKVRINGVDVSTVIDTRYEKSMVDLHTAKRMGLVPEASSENEVGTLAGFYDEQYKIWDMPVPEMSIGSYRMQNVRLGVADMTLSGEMLVLGRDFLQNHRVLVSMSQRKLYISHLGGPAMAWPPRS